jgi:hypothetical protein
MSLALKMMPEECEIQFQHSLKIIETVVSFTCAHCLFVHACTGNVELQSQNIVSVMFSLLHNIKGMIAEARITQSGKDCLRT